MVLSIALVILILEGNISQTIDITKQQSNIYITENQSLSDNFNSSFYANTTQNNSWLVVKFSSIETIFIDEINIYTYFVGENMRIEYENIILSNLKNKTYMLGGAGCGVGGFGEFFIHMKMGSFNFTVEHLVRAENYNEMQYCIANITLFPDIWYLIGWISCDKKNGSQAMHDKNMDKYYR